MVEHLGNMMARAVPVLMYHALSEQPDRNPYTLTLSTFAAQMRYLRDAGMRGVGVGEFLSGQREGVVVLTFDDGNWSDAARAWPLLRELGFGATFYVTAGRVSEQPSRTSWEQLRDLAGSGAEIGCHGRTHAFLDSRDRGLLEFEIAGAKGVLEDGIGARVDHFSLPGGRYREETLRCCRAAGFASVATSRPGYAVAERDDGLVILDRFALRQGQSQRHFRDVASGSLPRMALDRSAYYAKRSINGLVGNDIYRSLWSRQLKGRGLWRKSFSG
jgi:peptidoglycan/xylan/chitin deacetylase (PgdA/CDA1 family)